MLDYLKQFDITEQEINLIKQTLNRDLIKKFEVMRSNVTEVLTYLTSYGVNKIINIIIYRPDICFRNKKSLEQSLTTLDKELLLFVFNNSIDDLSNFNI